MTAAVKALRRLLADVRAAIDWQYRLHQTFPAPPLAQVDMEVLRRLKRLALDGLAGDGEPTEPPKRQEPKRCGKWSPRVGDEYHARYWCTLRRGHEGNHVFPESARQP